MQVVKIPNSVRSIGRNSFKGCSSLKEIWSDIQYVEFLWMGDGVFEGIPLYTCILHIPNGSMESYKTAPQWRDFLCIEESHQNQQGDVNSDGEINIADVNAIIDVILSGYSNSNGDVNGDGEINIADVNAIIDMILTGSSITNNKIDISIAEESLYDIYKSMYTLGWSTTGNTHQCFGISAYNLMAEVMGDDFIMGAQGSGWFWFDATYNVKSRYQSTAWRSYDLWTAYYTWIAHSNVIINSRSKIKGNESEINEIVGQAYAIRAYSYFMLAQSFARTYKWHKNDPCVPINDDLIYSPPTGSNRAKVSEVYDHILNDIDKALNMLRGKEKKHPINIDYTVALGLKSRVALVKEDWDLAFNTASEVIESNKYRILDIFSFWGMNDCSKQNVMWGAKRTGNDLTAYENLFAHMSTEMAYGQRSPKQITKWLYNKMQSSDTRRAWWDPNDATFSIGGYVQKKFNFSDLSTYRGDYIWMRIEEMYLNAAEAACRMGQDSKAKQYLMALMYQRDPNYYCNKTGSALGALTTTETGSLLEEILIQRRIELWGEDGRIYTIRRLHQGFYRTLDMGWPSGALIPTTHSQDPDCYAWVMTIPLTEFLNNTNMSITYDQNPLGDYPSTDILASGPQNISFENGSLLIQTALSDTTIQVKLTRSSYEGIYSAIVLFDQGANMKLTSGNIVTFADGQNTAYVAVQASNLSLGTTASCKLHLSATDIANGDDTDRITSTDIKVVCGNVEPDNQNISFETKTQIITSDDDEITNVTVPIKLTRLITTHSYAAVVNISNSDDNVTLQNKYVVFDEGQNTAYAYVDIKDIQKGGIYTCTLSLSDNDIATADPSIGQQITSTILIYKCLGQNWVPAGSCTFTDYTWDEGSKADNVPIEQIEGTNQYRILSPLYYVYNGHYDNPSKSNWVFTLNDDTVSPLEGIWNMNYWDYTSLYDSENYQDYCYVEQSGNSYDVHFIVKSGSNLLPLGWFRFTWDR